MARKINALIVLVVLVLIGSFVYFSQKNPEGVLKNFPFRFGLDIAGGTQLVYRADTSAIDSASVNDAMASLRDTIERRVNLFGVGEPNIQTETAGAVEGKTEHQLVVELPGVTDIDAAISLIGKTPVLDFRLLSQAKQTELSANASTTPAEYLNAFQPTGLTGRFLTHTQLEFNGGTQGGLGTVGADPVVVVQFNDEGTKMFADLTKNHIGEVMGIFLDGLPISTPVIREEIDGGKAQISGSFTPDEAKELVRNLNYGALPLPIELISSQKIGPTLGHITLTYGVKAGLIGLALISLFLILWYRLPGFISTIALLGYVTIILALFKFIPVVLTAAGIAGLILSIGMAVDANILIFERFKEERRAGKENGEAIREGFSRAWPSIRDSNTSSLITSVILFWFGTSLVKGFALTFGLGVIVSMLSALLVTRVLLLALVTKKDNRFISALLGSGIRK